MTLTAITGARLFDGETVTPSTTVVLDDQVIRAVGGPVPAGATTVDGTGCTLLPGLFDSHVHAGPYGIDSFRSALTWGLTTELEMMGHWTQEERTEFDRRDDVADMRTALMGLCTPGGHPFELFGDHSGDHDPAADREGTAHGSGHGFRTVTSPDEAVAFVDEQVAAGADYIKVMIEEGTVLGAPHLPELGTATLAAAVEEAHRQGKQVLAHTLTADASHRAVELGVDGLAHLFMDRPLTPELRDAIVDSGAFVITCLVINASITGAGPGEFVIDQRVRDRLDPRQLEHLAGSFASYPQGDLTNTLDAARQLHQAGVDLLAGTDASLPGTLPGASLHHELQLLVAAGLDPIDALRAATSVPARRFGLTDRGRIRPGARADLLLVAGDPTSTITDTLNIRHIWRRGALLPCPS